MLVVGLIAVGITTFWAAVLAWVWARGSARDARWQSKPKVALAETRTVIRLGSQKSPTAERSALNLLASTALTLGAARAWTFLWDQRRPVRPLRNQRDNYRVHHFVPGIGLAALSGAASIISPSSERSPWLALSFGTGVGLTLDETGMLLGQGDVYWNRERLALIEGVVALAGAHALGARLVSRGEKLVINDHITPQDTRSLSVVLAQ